MNLLDKLTSSKIGLAMLPVLFFLFSCEEPSEIGLDMNPNREAVATHYVELPVESSQIYFDSISSTTASNIRIGRISDPYFGELTATAFTNIGLPNSVPVIDENVTLDSVKFQLTVVPNFTGEEINTQQTLRLYWLQQTIEPTATTTDEDGKTNLEYRYFTTDQESLEGAELIAEFSFDTTQFADIANNSNKLLSFNIPVNSSFAQQLFDKAKEGDSVLFSDQPTFDAFARALAIVPGEGNTYIGSYSLSAGTTRIDFYHSETANEEDDETPLTFRFTPRVRTDLTYSQFSTYFHLEPDYTGTALEGIETTEGTQEVTTNDGRVYFRAAAGLQPRVDFSSFREFVNADTLGSFIINQAFLEIDQPDGVSENQSLPTQIAFFFTTEDNRRISTINGTSAEIPLIGRRYITNEQDTVFQYVSSQSQQGLDLVIGLEQYLRSENEDYLRGLIYPNSGSTTSLQSFVVDPERIKLKIYYTTLRD